MEPQKNLSELKQDIVRIGMQNYVIEIAKNDQLELEMIECAKGHADVVGGLACVGIEDIGLLLGLDKDEVVESIVKRSGFEAWGDDFLNLCNLIMDEYLQEIEGWNERHLNKK